MSALSESEIKACIESGFPGDSVTVRGDGRHFEAHVVSERFAGERLIKRHRMVYDALGDHMREDVHALSIKALTPEEYNKL